MIYYFLPDPGIFGGVKVGYQFAELLNSLGLRAVVASPAGKSPQWFRSSAAVLDEQEVLRNLFPSDWALFSLQTDYERLKNTPARLAFHCQGTNPMHAPTFRDLEVLIMTCWDQATQYVKEHFSRDPVEVGISVSDCFYFNGDLKHGNTVACMTRRGKDIIMACEDACPQLHFLKIDNMGEYAVSSIMKKTEIFIATAEKEWFGLPALEAMASGCVVLSVPVLGGMDFLRDGENCIIAEAGKMPDRLKWISHPKQAELRAKLRHNAVATAYGYRLSFQRKLLKGLLENRLKELIL